MPEYLTDRLDTNLDGMPAEVRSPERGSAGIPAEPPLLRGRRDISLRCGDRLGSANGPSPGHRGRDGFDLGSSGVSVFGLQLARVLGARLIATTSTAEKADRLPVRYAERGVPLF